MPENTLGAMAMALDQGADGVELDVRLSGDSQLVVIHDGDLKRVAGADVNVAQSTAEQLGQHDLGQGQRVPALDQVLELVLGRGSRINVELKVDEGTDGSPLVDAVVARVNRMSADEASRVLLTSFDGAAVERLCDRLGDLAVALLFERPVSRFPPVAGLHPRHTLVQADHVELAHETGLFVNVWTVNDPADAARVIDAGVDGIITDDVPAILDYVRSTS
jgi:glycerophosphoryl diester phosphodiesterase